MYKFFIFFLSLIGVLQAWIDPSCDHFHICTVANRPDPYLDKLIQSCEIHGIQLEILGMNEPYYGNSTKMFRLREYLNALRDEEIILFVDAFDVLIIADKNTILQKFLKMSVPFVMAAEKHCWPCEKYINEEYLPCQTPFKYLNTGTYIGYVSHLKKWIDDLALNIHWCDQAQTIEHWSRNAENKKLYHFDCNCELFLPLFIVGKEEVIIDESGIFHCLTTHSTPCMIHANGHSFDPIWDMVYEKLVKR